MTIQSRVISFCDNNSLIFCFTGFCIYWFKIKSGVRTVVIRKVKSTMQFRFVILSKTIFSTTCSGVSRLNLTNARNHLPFHWLLMKAMIFDMGEFLVLAIHHQERKDSGLTIKISAYLQTTASASLPSRISLLTITICSLVGTFWFSFLNFEAKYPLRAFSVRVHHPGSFFNLATP